MMNKEEMTKNFKESMENMTIEDALTWASFGFALTINDGKVTGMAKEFGK